MDRGGSVARCRLIAVSTGWTSRPANLSGSRIEGYRWREELWGLTPESGSTMRASGRRNPGDSGCVGSQFPLGPDAQKNRGAPDRSGTPLGVFVRMGRLFDLPITGDLRGGCDRRSNLDLWTLDLRELSRALTFSNPVVIRIVQFLLGALDGFS